MDSQGSSVFVYLFLALLVLAVVLIVWMFVSLVRSELEDERRKLIVGKACTWTLIATVGANLIEVIEVAAAQPNGEPVAPFVRLVVTALMYAIFLGWFKHKWKIRSGRCGRSGASPRRTWPGGAACPGRPSTPLRTTSTTPPSPWPSAWPGSWG